MQIWAPVNLDNLHKMLGSPLSGFEIFLEVGAALQMSGREKGSINQDLMTLKVRKKEMAI